MGREASCPCHWGSEAAICKVLLEPPDLIVRGAIRRRVPLSTLTAITVKGEQLTFRAGEEKVALDLGSEQAKKWAAALTAPSPSLAKKLGIAKTSKILLIGKTESAELDAALAEANAADDREASLIMACVRTPAELDRALEQSHPADEHAPLWIVYPKGAGQKISQSMVLETLRGRGFTDTKVASVSAQLTGLRFIRRSR